MLSRFLISAGIVAVSSHLAAAKPLVTSSEDTVARICLARQETPQRLVAACDAALGMAQLTQSQRAGLLVARGDGFLWQGNHAQARASYSQATAVDPRSVEAWNGLGWALWELSGDQAAYDAFSHSLSIEVSVQGLGGKAALARRMGLIDNDTAREMLAAALAIDPDYIWAMREMGWSHFEDRNFKAAAATFREALDIEPHDENARYGLGRALLSQGKAEDALDIFTDVLADAPRDFPTLVYRIIALRDLDRNAQALRFADRLIEAFPDRTSGYVQRAQALMALERRVDAIQTYVLANETLGPTNTILYWHADALALDGRFAEALQVIDRGLALEGADYSDHLMKSYIALELQDYATARTSAETSLAMGGDDPWAHYYIAISLVHDGDTPGGLLRFEKALSAGLPAERIKDFATELVGAGKYVEAAQLRLKY